MTEGDRINTFFSSDIHEATDKFLQACNYSGAQYEIITHPLKGPAGDPIHTVVAWLGPRNATRVALFIAGTHGVEGYAGSGIMIGALSNDSFAVLPEDTAVMMIHLINPWGCAWGHRHTENNADLFRDAIYYKPELYCDDGEFDQTYRLASTPLSWFGREKQRSDEALLKIIESQGLDELIRIARIGQHKYPDTQCYNGDGNSWSTRLYHSLCKKYLSHAKQVFCVDFHTGFGEYGEGICIPYYHQDEQGQRKLQRLKDAFGEKAIFEAGFDPTIPTHPRAPWETIEDFIPDVEMTCTGLEFGTYTYDIDTVIEINRYMNYLLVHGDLSKPECSQLYDQYQKLYYPAQEDWKQSVFSRGAEVSLQAVSSLAEAWS